MDYGLMRMEGMVGQHQQGGSFDQNSKRKCCVGSGSYVEEDDQSRASKLTRNGLDLGPPKQVSLLRSASSCDGAFGGPQQAQMVSFSSPTSEVSFLSAYKDGGGGVGGGGLPLSYYQNSSAAPVGPRINGGYASGSFTGIRGPFTPAQWVELEHQALIYKYFTANVPVPATLLIPIRKALNSSGLSGLSYPAHSYGWGSLYQGYSRGSTDPEPGRCRRTDGKKWRCSRDSVSDQKYCERHINRGRHRSRKPVEGQTGQAPSGPTNPKVVPTSSSVSSSATSGGSSSHSLAVAAHQLTSLEARTPNLVTDSIINRLQGSQGFSVMPTYKDSLFSVPNQHVLYEESPQSAFGFVPSESLLIPSPRVSYPNSKTYNSSGINDQQRQQDQHQIRHLVDEWPADESNRSTIPWPDELNSALTQLSIPMSELSSSSSNQETTVASPLRLSRELDQTRMGPGANEAGYQHNWVPISWGNSMGDPLGEVLNNAGGSLIVMTEGLDSSRHFSYSPTGVLQKGASVSNSNSASASSPRDEDKMNHDDLLGSAHAASSSIL